MKRHYKAFISYSWSDKEWGAWLHRTLELYRTPKQLVGAETPLGPAPARLHPIFKDREEEAAGHGIGAAIEEAMGASEFLIVLCSPRSAKSKWVNREVAWFKTHKSKERILALVVDGEPGASLSQTATGEECFPATLLYKVDENLQPTQELEDVPLAADARKEGDGKRIAKLKLAAALLGVGLDDLVKRDDRRRAARRRWAMSGMAASMMVLSGLTVFAFQQRDAARAAQSLAEIAQAEAEFERDEAFDLIEFMITDFQKPLAAVGRLDIFEKVGERLKTSFEKRDLAKLEADALGQQARVNLLLGNVDNERGDLDAALSSYKQAAATTAEQLRRDPDNEQRIYDHAQSTFWVGYIAWQRGDAATARDHFTQYHAHATRLVEIDPANKEWQAELMYAHSNLGQLAMDQNEGRTAETHFREAVTLSETIYGKQPSTPEDAYEVGQSYSGLSSALYHVGEFEEARKARLKEIYHYTSYKGYKTNSYIRKSEVEARLNNADMLIGVGLLEEAFLEASKAAKIAEIIRDNDRTNLDNIDTAVHAYVVLGEAQLHLRKFDDVETSLETAFLLAEELVKKDKTLIRWSGKTHPLSMLLKAKVKEALGKKREALAVYTELSGDLKSQVSLGIKDATIMRSYCSALSGRSRLTNETKFLDIEIFELLANKKDKLGPKFKTVLIEALARSGQTQAAIEEFRALYQTGYRHPEFITLGDTHPAFKDLRL